MTTVHFSFTSSNALVFRFFFTIPQDMRTENVKILNHYHTITSVCIRKCVLLDYVEQEQEKSFEKTQYVSFRLNFFNTCFINIHNNN